MNELQPRTVRFGAVQFNHARRQLFVGEELHRLTPKDAGVLQQLLEAAPDPVNTEELLARNWPRVVVGDNAVQQVILRLRRLLDDDAQAPRYIETVTKIGYRLLMPAEVSEIALETETNEPPVVAVLPLRDLSPMKDMEWLALGITEEVRHQISKIGHRKTFRVVPGILVDSSSSQNYHADLILSGSVSGSKDGASVVIDLTDMTDQTLLWSEEFTDPHSDPIPMRQAISGSISRFFGESVNAIRWSWGPKKPQAYGPFLQYLRVLHAHQSWEQEKELLFRVMDFDPNWETGWGLASDLWQQAVVHGVPNALEKALETAHRGPKVTKNRQVLAARARLLAYWDGDLDGAERYMRKHQMWFEYALLMSRSGLYREVARFLRHFVENVRPYSVSAWQLLGFAHTALREHDQAVMAINQANRFAPHNASDAWWPLIWSLPASGRIKAAKENVRRLRAMYTQLAPDSVAASLNIGQVGCFEWRIGQETGNPQLAQAGIDHYLTSRYHEQSSYIMMLDIDDPRADEYVQHARKHIGAQRYNWLSNDPFVSAKVEALPAMKSMRQELGFTNEWRLELSKRASTLPANTQISSDPSNYEE